MSFRARSLDPAAFGPRAEPILRAALAEIAADNARFVTTIDMPTQSQIYTREEDVQRKTIEALEMAGFIVLQTSVRHKLTPCQKCGQPTRPFGSGYGSTKGVPDLLVRHADWPAGVWGGVEMKGAKTKVSPAQQQLQIGKHIFICRDVKSAVEAVMEMDREMRRAA